MHLIGTVREGEKCLPKPLYVHWPNASAGYMCGKGKPNRWTTAPVRKTSCQTPFWPSGVGLLTSLAKVLKRIQPSLRHFWIPTSCCSFRQTADPPGSVCFHWHVIWMLQLVQLLTATHHGVFWWQEAVGIHRALWAVEAGEGQLQCTCPQTALCWHTRLVYRRQLRFFSFKKVCYCYSLAK